MTIARGESEAHARRGLHEEAAYRSRVTKNLVGRLNFFCDLGWIDGVLRKAASADLFALRCNVPLRVQVLDGVNRSESERHLLGLFALENTPDHSLHH